MARAPQKTKFLGAVFALAAFAVAAPALAQDGGDFNLSLEEFLNQPENTAQPIQETEPPQAEEGPYTEPDYSADYSAEYADETQSEMSGQQQPSGGIGSEAGDDAGVSLFDDAFGTTPTAAAPDEEPMDATAEDDVPEDYSADGMNGDMDADQASDINIFGEAVNETPAKQPLDDDKIILDFTPENQPDLKIDPNTEVTLRGLDKITARISEHKVKVGQPYKFGTLAIVLRTCVKAPPEETPEVTAFLEITEWRDDEAKELFKGWMYASNPAISALEHPVYDVWVIDCNIVSGLEE